MKRSLIAGLVFAVGLLFASGRSAQAQVVNGAWQLSPQSGNTRRGVATPPKEQVVVVAPGTQPVLPVQPVTFFVIPAVLMSDGTVLANFGFGFEPVTRSCAGNVVISSQPTVIAGNGQVLSRHTIPQTTPSQITASQQMLRTQSRFPILTAASQTACFSMDHQTGRFFVVRQ